MKVVSRASTAHAIRAVLLAKRLTPDAPACVPACQRTDAAIRGHIGCTFLALLLRKELLDRLAAYRAPALQWQTVVDDLFDLSAVEVEQDGRRPFCVLLPDRASIRFAGLSG